MGFVFLALSAVVAVRLGKLMIYSEDKVSEYAARQKYGSLELHNPRGVIYDRNMNELAMSIRLKSVYINPRKMGPANKAAWAMASAMAAGGGKETGRLAHRFKVMLTHSRDRQFMWVERKIEPEVYQRLKAAKQPGMGFVDEYRRFYPKKDMAAKIIGFCGMDNKGLSGVEYYYDRQIQGINARSKVRKDALGRPVDSPEALGIPEAYIPYDMELTIDERIQYVAERALMRKVEATSAVGGVAIVMDPHTGEVLAIAEQPRFNPNSFGLYGAESFKSHAISIPVEPGSTFKVFVAAAALEEKVLRPADIINCENGSYTVGDKTFKEAHSRKFGKIPAGEVIAQSSNIGAIKIGERLGRDRMDAYLRRFGFGVRTGVDLPGESPGMLREAHKWSQASVPSISFGQEVSVTPIQLLTAFSPLANGGWLVKPRVVKALLQEGRVVKTFGAEPRARVLSESTVKIMNGMMRGVVERGTGAKAAVEGFAVAGKTGTAQVFDNRTGAYSENKYIASFIGFFPAEDPALMILVMIDSPSGVAYGGAVAAPVFAEIAARAARILRIPGAGTKIYVMDFTPAVPSAAPHGGGNT